MYLRVSVFFRFQLSFAMGALAGFNILGVDHVLRVSVFYLDSANEVPQQSFNWVGTENIIDIQWKI